MRVDCSPEPNAFRLKTLHADDSNRVRVTSMAHSIDDGKPVVEWKVPAHFWVAGYGPGIVILTWIRSEAGPDATCLKVDHRGRLNLGLLPRHLRLHQEWLIGVAELEAGQLILVDAPRLAAAVWALCAFTVSDVQRCPELPMIGTEPVKVQKRRARMFPINLWNST